MINKVILVGNLGQDPEVKDLDNEKKVAKFSIATVEKWKDNEETTWHNIEVWNKLATIVEKYIKKGQQVYIEGSIKNQTWNDSEGNKKYRTVIVANTIKMLGKKDSVTTQAETNVKNEGLNDGLEDDNDPLPF